MKRFLAVVLGGLVLAIVGVCILVRFFGLHVELAGSGRRPIFSFGDREKHYRELERNRAAQAPPTLAVAATPQSAPAPIAAATGSSDYWTDFRGPGRRGVYDQKPILLKWPSNGLPRVWRIPVGGGYASLTIAGGLAFTIEQRRDREVVAAYELRTGRERWTNSWQAFFQESQGGDGPRSTPVYDDGRIYALGAEGELRCLDAASGKVIWNKNILEDNGARNLDWGMAGSPLVVDGKVIVNPGGPNGRSVVAYDKLSGKRVWSSLDDTAAYTSPMLVTLTGKRQVLVVTAARAVGLTVDEGKLLWEYPWVTEYDVNAAQPVITAPNRFFISAGYDHGAAAVELDPAGHARTVWSNNRMKNRFNSSVLYQGYLYGIDEGILSCMNAETGEQKWKGGRYGYGELLLASGHLVILTEDGEVVLVRATPDKLQELAKFEALDGKTWNHPAIADGLLLVRNTTDMACFRISD